MELHGRQVLYNHTTCGHEVRGATLDFLQLFCRDIKYTAGVSNTSLLVVTSGNDMPEVTL